MANHPEPPFTAQQERRVREIVEAALDAERDRSRRLPVPDVRRIADQAAASMDLSR